MILRKLSDFIIMDEISLEANSSELYFLSHLMGTEMLSLPDDWPARIYTSKFIFDVISKKKPYVKMSFFRILRPNEPVKFRSKDKIIMVTMFETGEVTNNVMFYFEDEHTTHLYSGIFTEVHRLNLNRNFKRVLDKGIDYIYIDTTRCRGKSFVFMEDTIEEVSQISTSNPNKSIALVLPDFGHEVFLVGLLHKLPQKVYPTSNQRKVLARLGYGQLIGKPSESRITIHPPGITTDYIQMKNLLTIYTAEGKPSVSACGIQTCQWSPLPSVMNLQELLELTRPRNIVPIKRLPLEETVSLPPSFKFFLSPRKSEVAIRANSPSACDSSMESLMCGDSNRSDDSVYDVPGESEKSKPPDQNTEVKQPSRSRENGVKHESTSQQKTTSAASTNANRKECEPVKNRMREIRRPHEFEYEDSDEG